ncbi:hypothetical protein K0M31_001428, partial [Melipona bicolor]
MQSQKENQDENETKQAKRSHRTQNSMLARLCTRRERDRIAKKIVVGHERQRNEKRRRATRCTSKRSLPIESRRKIGAMKRNGTVGTSVEATKTTKTAKEYSVETKSRKERHEA